MAKLKLYFGLGLIIISLPLYFFLIGIAWLVITIADGWDWVLNKETKDN